MSMEQMEVRLAAVERELAAVKRQLNTPDSGRPAATTPAKWWEPIGPPMTPEESKAFDEAMAYGRYFRKAGREAPPDWKPGDPIPDEEIDE